MNEIVSQLIKKARKKSGYTQQQVADLLGVDRSTYSYYELGKIKPDIKTIINLSKVFGVTYVELLESENVNKFSDVSNVKDEKEKIKSDEHAYLANVTNLTKKEQDIVMLFRLLSGKSQDNVLRLLLKNLKDNES